MRSWERWTRHPRRRDCEDLQLSLPSPLNNEVRPRRASGQPGMHLIAATRTRAFSGFGVETFGSCGQGYKRFQLERS